MSICDRSFFYSLFFSISIVFVPSHKGDLAKLGVGVGEGYRGMPLPKHLKFCTCRMGFLSFGPQNWHHSVTFKPIIIGRFALMLTYQVLKVLGSYMYVKHLSSK